MRRRSALQTLIITAAVVIGLMVITRGITQSRGAESESRARASRPNVAVVDATPEQLTAVGYRLDERSPKTWSQISIRLFEDDRGSINLMRCHIQPEEAQLLVSFPVDARRSVDGLPPSDWPRGDDGDPFQVPAWWQPSGKCSRYAEIFAPGSPGRGVYADYDVTTGWYHCWTWSRRDVAILRPNLLDHLVADELASGLADLAVRSGWPSDADGWLSKEGLGVLESGSLAKRLPPGVERLDARVLPLASSHRYFIRLVGIDLTQARQVIGEVPMREIPMQSMVPTTVWAAALPPEGLPTWFAPTAGPRWAYCLVRVGDGAVERGRWAAYSEAERALYLWDWDGPTPLPNSADVTNQ